MSVLQMLGYRSGHRRHRASATITMTGWEWHRQSLYNLGDLRPDILRLVAHVYKQTDRANRILRYKSVARPLNHGLRNSI